MGQRVICHAQGGMWRAIEVSRKEGERWEMDGPPLFIDWLSSYLTGKTKKIDPPLSFDGATPFQIEVWEALRQIPHGKTVAYGALLEGKGYPRAVGQAVKRNRFPLYIPCHRVVAAKGLGGYALGSELKKFLLDLENKSF